jgi:hypothetical protein
MPYFHTFWTKEIHHKLGKAHHRASFCARSRTPGMQINVQVSIGSREYVSSPCEAKEVAAQGQLGVYTNKKCPELAKPRKTP